MGLNPITQSWVDPSVIPVDKQLTIATSRSFSEAIEWFNSGDIKRAELKV